MPQAATPARATAPAHPVHAEDECALAARLMAGEVSAFAELLDAWWAPLVAYAAQMLGAQDAAEDAVQETFVRVWENHARLNPTRSLRGYLYRLTRNLVIDEVRKGQTRVDRVAFVEAQTPTTPTPAQVVEADELAAAAGRAIERLAERRREVFILAHFHDLSYRQIADVLGITPRTVANHMTLALRELRAALQPFLDREPSPR
jgi:RNA polymerase sigma-70 factor (ECF subfamily)